MIVTTEKGRLNKIHISLDGQYKLTVDEGFWLTLDIKEKSDISTEDFEKISALIFKRRAYNKSIDLLSAREHSRKELSLKLRERGYGDVAQEVCDELEKAGYLNDERFAEMYLNELRTKKSFGINRLRQELLRKGIRREIIDTLLSETEIDSSTEIKSLLQRKYPNFLADEKSKRRAVNALLRYGHSFGDIKKVMSEFDNDDFSYHYIDEQNYFQGD